MSNLEKAEDTVSSIPADNVELDYNPALDRRIKWRRDIVLIPVLGLMYLVMFLDRTNIANARIEGLEAGLDMPSNGYNVALSVFYVPFVLFEIPSNLVLSLPFISPRWYLGAMMTLLGETPVPPYKPLLTSRQASSQCVRASVRAMAASSLSDSSWVSLRLLYLRLRRT